MEVTPEIALKLPSWSSVMAQYGSEPDLYHCSLSMGHHPYTAHTETGESPGLLRPVPRGETLVDTICSECIPLEHKCLPLN
eukprot:6147516-Ditylum_brightwellii.AAC.1